MSGELGQTTELVYLYKADMNYPRRIVRNISLFLRHRNMGIRIKDGNSRQGKVDLHIHTIYSDGFHSPREVLAAASYLGLRAISIADHDTFEGNQAAQAIASQYGIEVIPAVEVSVERISAADLHILAYFSKFPDGSNLVSKLREIRERRVERAHRVIRALNQTGIDVSEKEVKSCFKFGYSADQQIAEVLRRKHLAPTFEYARNILIGEAVRLFGVKQIDGPPLETTIKLIREVGGVAIWAHPVYDYLPLEISAVLRRLAFQGLLGKRGLAGFEAQSSKYQPHHSMSLQLLTRDFIDLSGVSPLETAGSDFHRAGHGLGVGTNDNLNGEYQIVEQLKGASY